MKKSINLNYEQNKKESKSFVEMLECIDNFPKPTISLVNGHAFGGALGVIAAVIILLVMKNVIFVFQK